MINTNSYAADDDNYEDDDDDDNDDGDDDYNNSNNNSNKHTVVFICMLFYKYPDINGFVQEPRSQTVYLEDTVVILCELDALPHPRVYWYKDNRALNTSSTNHFIHSNNALELRNVRASDFGRYQCRAVNEGGERFSHSAQLTENSNYSSLQ